jgi:hypothetical protein
MAASVDDGSLGGHCRHERCLGNGWLSEFGLGGRSWLGLGHGRLTVGWLGDLGLDDGRLTVGGLTAGWLGDLGLDDHWYRGHGSRFLRHRCAPTSLTAAARDLRA